jgi:signal transduction histidine kinase
MMIHVKEKEETDVEMVRKRKRFAVLYMFILTMGLFTWVYSWMGGDSHAPKAQNGVLDLTKWDFTQFGNVNLDGQWEFYQNELLTPDDFKKVRFTNKSYLQVPDTWLSDAPGNEMSRRGFGTYRLVIKLQDPSQIYGIKMNNIRTSHRLFMNGQLEGKGGIPAVDANHHTSGNVPYSTIIRSASNEIEVVIQVANFEYVSGGIVKSIQFGLYRDIIKLNSIQLGINIGIILILGMFSIYHLSFFFMRRQEKSYLYSGLYLFMLLIVQLFLGERIGTRFLGDIPFVYIYKLLDISEFSSAVLILLFFYSINQRLLTKRRLFLINLPIVIYMLMVMVLPYPIVVDFKVYVLLYLVLVNLYILGKIVYLFLRDPKSTDSTELLLLIGANVCLWMYMVSGALYSENVISSDLSEKIGIVGFITMMNILLAFRFTNAFEKTEMLSQQLALSNQLKDEFLANTSHELKTPLHGIMNITSHLLNDEADTLTTKQKQNLWLIKDTSTKLSMLIHDLIDVTLIKHGELRLSPTVVDIKIVTQIVLDVLQFEQVGKELELENVIEDDVWVLADENRLRQILYNLVQNAIKYTEKGVIRVSSRYIDHQVCISVEDSGVGIPFNKHETIFNYFEQLSEPLPQDGTTSMGLGLFISRKLVEQMQGEIYVDWSEVGVGTRFSFTLPSFSNVQGITDDTGVTTPSEIRQLKQEKSLDIIEQHQYTILIVDDEASNIHTMRNILQRHRYNIITAFSAQEALLKLRKYPQIDLVILDVMMPKVSGIQLCQTLREQYSIIDLPILFATVRDSSQDIALGFRAGANDYITKPFNEDTLTARVYNLISMKTAIHEAIRNELAFHHAQIKPHFLYNALSSVISFCYSDGEMAAELLSMLSQYLRYILDMDYKQQFVPLQHELDLIHAYVEIEKVRFANRFIFHADVDETLLDVEIPSLCIQPFIENAIRHGLFHKRGQGNVTLSIQEGSDHMKITIEDDGVGISEEVLYQIQKGEGKLGEQPGTGGIGIQNIYKRIKSIQGTKLSIFSELGHGTRVTLYLPLYQVKELERN